MRQVIEGLHAADSLEALKRAGEDIRRLDAEPARAGRGRRTADADDRRAQRRAVAPRDRARRCGRHDLADIDWCWLALGSEGRGEQTFATDQDNALLFAAARRDGRQRRARSAARVRARRQCEPRHARISAVHGQCDGEQSGALPVDGRVEGQVPARGFASRRRRHCSTRTSSSISGRSTATRRSADALREWLFGYTQASPMFLRLMVQNALDVEPPLGLIRAFAVDDDPGRQGHARPEDARHAAVRRLRARVRAGARHRRHRHGRAAAPAPASACTSRRGTSTRRSRRSTSCSCCACGSRTSRPVPGKPNRIDPVRAARDRPADAEGGVPPGEATAGAAAVYPTGSAPSARGRRRRVARVDARREERWARRF